tara:strand:+ start:1789 stop:3456 length:1668 start_codon:yes stop_codon:yes gene_type:complete
MLGLEEIMQSVELFIQTPKGKELISSKLGVDLEIAGSSGSQTKEQAQKLKKIIKSIRIETYTVKGRVYDKQKKTPIEGLSVKPMLLLYPMVVEKDEDGNDVYIKKFYATNAKTGIQEELTEKRWNRLQERRDKFDERQERRQERQQERLEEGEELEEAKSFKWSGFRMTEKLSFIVEPDKDKREEGKQIKTDANGEYEFRFGVPAIGDIDYPVIPLKPFILYNVPLTKDEEPNPDYTPYVQQMIKGDHTVKEELPPIGLINISELSEIEKQKIVDEINKQIDKALDGLMEPVEKLINSVKAQILGVATVVQQKLLPLAIGLMLNFGIAKLAQKQDARCPDNTILRACIKRRNSIVRQLNNIYAVIIANTALAAAFLYISSNFIVIEKIIKKLPIPLQFASYPVVSKLQEVQDLLADFANEFKNIRKSVLIGLIILIICLFIILKYLKTIDELIGDCSDGQLDMEEINAQLLVLQAQATAQGEVPQEFVNGFELSVVADTENSQDYGEGDLYQRYAVAKDSRGVVVLKGEKSFAAEDQILIDELAFYIRQNDLKAN